MPCYAAVPLEFLLPCNILRPDAPSEGTDRADDDTVFLLPLLARLRVQACQGVRLLLFGPHDRVYSSVVHNIGLKGILLREISPVGLNLGTQRKVARPVGIYVGRKRVPVGRYVSTALWVSIILCTID